MTGQTITLDVCEDIRAGREPFGKIMATVGRLGAGDELILLAPFEPVPLFHVLAKHGFEHVARQKPAGVWEVSFRRPQGGTPTIPENNGASSIPITDKPPELEVDARGLEPPQPLIRILEALGNLPKSAVLKARTDRRPMHLYGELETRGFIGKTEEEVDGSYITNITRK
jgi:uncharacterized protein (DUF2249 family)